MSSSKPPQVAIELVDDVWTIAIADQFGWVQAGTGEPLKDNVVAGWARLVPAGDTEGSGEAALSAHGVGSLSEAIALALGDTYAGIEFEDSTFERGTAAIMAVLREHLAGWRPPLPEVMYDAGETAEEAVRRLAAEVAGLRQQLSSQLPDSETAEVRKHILWKGRVPTVDEVADGVRFAIWHAMNRHPKVCGVVSEERLDDCADSAMAEVKPVVEDFLDRLNVLRSALKDAWKAVDRLHDSETEWGWRYTWEGAAVCSMGAGEHGEDIVRKLVAGMARPDRAAIVQRRPAGPWIEVTS